MRRAGEPKDTSLPDRIVAAAEALYAKHGFADVSFRQICTAAGAKNNFAVQYHFGDVEALALAIVERQSTHYELRRGEGLIEATRDGSLTVRAILEILERPVIERIDDRGEPLGARFMVALQNTDWGWRPLSSQFERAPVTRQLVAALEGLLPSLPPSVVWQRLYLTSLMIMNCAAQIPRNATDQFQAAVLENVFLMATAAMQAELDRETAEHMMELHTGSSGAPYGVRSR